MSAGVINMSTAVYINNSDDRSNGNVMEGDDNNGEEEEEQLRGATANPVAPVDLGILNLDDEDLTLVRLLFRNPLCTFMCDKHPSYVALVHLRHLKDMRLHVIICKKEYLL